MTARTVSEIYEEIKADIMAANPALCDWSLNSMNRVTTMPIAMQFQITEEKIERAANAQNPMTATGADLDELVRDRGLTRLEGSKAIGQVSFVRLTEALADIPIPIGTEIAASAVDGPLVIFVTTEAATLSSGTTSVDVHVEASDAGIRGNVRAGVVSIILGSLPLIDYVTNTLPFEGGTAEESDLELVQRYITTVSEYGRATVPTIKERLEALYNSDSESVVSEAIVYNMGSGDAVIVVDTTPSVENIEIVQDGIEDNLAAGVCSRGMLAAHLEDGDNQGDLGDAAGGKLWVRARVNITSADTFTVGYETSGGVSHTANFTVPSGTVIGQAVLGTLEDPTDQVASVPLPTYTGDFEYDVLIGYGAHPYLFLVPEKVEIDVTMTYTPTETASATLGEDIEAAIETFLGEYRIGDDVEFSDVYDAARIDPSTGMPFDGIDSVDTLSVTDGSSTITALGETITIEDDARVEAGDVTVTETV
jgi:uncharacterized phage protein gp47/JayE